MKRSVDAVVLSAEGRKESDRLVTLLCRDGSIIRAYASGARNPKNRLCAATEPFVLACYDIFESNGSCVIDDAEISRQFFKLRWNVSGYALAGYLSQLITAVFYEQTESELYGVYINILYLLAENKRSPKLMKAAAEFHIAAVAGWCPNVTSCPDCGQEDSSKICFFSIPDGRAYCADCAAKHPQAFKADSSVLRAIEYSIDESSRKMFSFNLTGDSLEAFSLIAEAFMRYYIEVKLPALDYYHSLIKPLEGLNGL